VFEACVLENLNGNEKIHNINVHVGQFYFTFVNA